MSAAELKTMLERADLAVPRRGARPGLSGMYDIAIAVRQADDVSCTESPVGLTGAVPPVS